MISRLGKRLLTDSAAIQALTKANQQSVDKMNEYKERYRGLKAAVGDKEKQLDLAKRTIERLSGQCNAMEVRTCCIPSEYHLVQLRCIMCACCMHQHN